MASIGATAMVTSLFLPETLGVKLPQDISEAENLLVDQPFWCYRGWRPCRKKNLEEKQKPSADVDDMGVTSVEQPHKRGSVR